MCHKVCSRACVSPALIAALACVPAAVTATEAAPAAPTEALPFIADDYARALREAKETKRPLFVEAWAPW